MTEVEVSNLLEALSAAETGTVILEPQSQFNGGIVGFDGESLIYEYDATIRSLAEEYDYEGALEWFSYNTMRSLPYINNAPIIWYREENEILYPYESDILIEKHLGLKNSLSNIINNTSQEE